MTEFLNFHVLPGIVLGSIYALGAVGVSLTFGILRFANFAHGALMTLGAYLSYTLVVAAGLPVLAALPFAMLGTGVAALGMDRAFFRPLRASPSVILVIASFGLMLMLQSLIQLCWGVQVRPLRPGIEPAMPLGLGLRIPPRHLVIIGAAIGLMLAMHLLLSRTRIGKAMRAMADSPELARITGVRTEHVIAVTWLIGGALAAAAGTLLGLDTHIETQMGFRILLPVFAAAILGGIGQPYGAMAGGLAIGLVEELSTYAWFGDAPLVSPGYKTGIAFAIMVLMLIVRPTGLFRGRVF